MESKASKILTWAAGTVASGAELCWAWIFYITAVNAWSALDVAGSDMFERRWRSSRRRYHEVMINVDRCYTTLGIKNLEIYISTIVYYNINNYTGLNIGSKGNKLPNIMKWRGKTLTSLVSLVSIAGTGSRIFSQGRLPFSIITIMYRTWWCTKWIRRLVRIVDLPLHPLTGKPTNPAHFWKYTL